MSMRNHPAHSPAWDHKNESLARDLLLWQDIRPAFPQSRHADVVAGIQFHAVCVVFRAKFEKIGVATTNCLAGLPQRPASCSLGSILCLKNKTRQPAAPHERHGLPHSRHPLQYAD